MQDAPNMACTGQNLLVARSWSTLLRGAESNNRTAFWIAGILLKPFFGSGPYLARLMQELFDRGFEYSNMIDVGAGAYGAVGDQPLVLLFADTFSRKGTVSPARPLHAIGFEPRESNRVHQLARNMRKPAGLTLTTSTDAVSDRVGLLTLTKKLHSGTNTATANPRLLKHRHYANSTDRLQIRATTIDEAMRRYAMERVDWLKTDTEGCEWEVLQGAMHALKAKRIRMLTVAYEDKWSFSTLSAVDPPGIGGRVVVPPTVDDMDFPTLRGTTRFLHSLGYESYLVGAHKNNRTRNNGLQFIPLSGDCWDDSFELGRWLGSRIFHATWFDFVSVLVGSAESAMIRDVIATSELNWKLYL